MCLQLSKPDDGTSKPCESTDEKWGYISIIPHVHVCTHELNVCNCPKPKSLNIISLINKVSLFNAHTEYSPMKSILWKWSGIFTVKFIKGAWNQLKLSKDQKKMYPSSINQNTEMNAQYREMQRTMLPATQETLNRYIQNDCYKVSGSFVPANMMQLLANN